MHDRDLAGRAAEAEAARRAAQTVSPRRASRHATLRRSQSVAAAVDRLRPVTPRPASCWSANCAFRPSRRGTSDRRRRRASCRPRVARDRRHTCATGRARRRAGPAASGARSRRAVSAPRTIVASWHQGGDGEAELLDHHVEGAELAAMAPEDAVGVDVERRRIEPLRQRSSTSGGATNRKTASGSTKRRISHGQAMRSIFGRARVTQTVRPRAVARRQLAGRHHRSAPGRPALLPPSSCSAATPEARSERGDALAELRPSGPADRRPPAARRKAGRPAGGVAPRTPDRAGNQAGIGGEILIGPHDRGERDISACRSGARVCRRECWRLKACGVSAYSGVGTRCFGWRLVGRS